MWPLASAPFEEEKKPVDNVLTGFPAPPGAPPGTRERCLFFCFGPGFAAERFIRMQSRSRLSWDCICNSSAINTDVLADVSEARTAPSFRSGVPCGAIWVDAAVGGGKEGVEAALVVAGEVSAAARETPPAPASPPTTVDVVVDVVIDVVTEDVGIGVVGAVAWATSLRRRDVSS